MFAFFGCFLCPAAWQKETKGSLIYSFFAIFSVTAYCKLDEECRKGRMCRNGMCVCLPDDGCTGHHKPVCGSDGIQYPSHCELHRTACVTRVHIKIDHLNNCVMKCEWLEVLLAGWMITTLMILVCNTVKVWCSHRRDDPFNNTSFCFLLFL